LSINNIILGTVQFGLNYGINNKKVKPNSKEIEKILNFAYDSGVNMLDTAEAYGTSQLEIGKYHKKSNHKFKVITKYHSNFITLDHNIEKRILNNIKELGVSNLYSYMFHSFNDFVNNYKKNIDQLMICKEKGLFEKTGVSIYTNSEFETVLNEYNVDLIQLPFNLLDNVNKRKKLIEKAKIRGIEIHTRSAFLQGLFFMQINSIPQKIYPLRNALIQLNQIAKSYNIDINQIALNYVMQQDGIDKVLIGVDNLNQLKTNLNNIDYILNNEIIELVNKINIEDENLLNPSNW
jgi:aryl-alcohol dehydrogenase-like predicted oxidoreductase